MLPQHRFHDDCLKIETRLSLGFGKLGTSESFGNESSFGSPGSGGSCGYADPHNNIGYAYVMNQMKARLIDPRDETLRRAMYRSIRKMSHP